MKQASKPSLHCTSPLVFLGEAPSAGSGYISLQHLLEQELHANGSLQPWFNDTNTVNPRAISRKVKRNCSIAVSCHGRTTKAQWHGKTEEYLTEETKKSRKERDGDEAKHLPLTRPKTLLKGLRACLMACCMPLTGQTTCTCVCLGQSSKPAAAQVTCYHAAVSTI